MLMQELVAKLEATWLLWSSLQDAAIRQTKRLKVRKGRGGDLSESVGDHPNHVIDHDPVPCVSSMHFNMLLAYIPDAIRPIKVRR